MRTLTLDTVLAATDLSDDDLPALRSAIELSRLAGSHLHVVHVAPGADADLDRKLEDHIRAADPSSDVMPGTTIRYGRADSAIVGVAGMINADVIVLGPHRPDRSRSPDGTAYRVAARAERPCLVLPGMMRLPLGRILVPIDASGAARGALAVGMTWASALRHPSSQSQTPTELVVLHVETPADEVGSGDDLMDELMADVNALRFEVSGVDVRRVREQGADAAMVILDYSVASDFDLVVLGTRAGSVMAPDLGSVSSVIVRSATRPLLLVPPRVWQERAGDE